MQKKYIKQAEQFVDTAIDIGKKLKTFTLDANNKKAQIESAIDKLIGKVESIHSDLNEKDPFQLKISGIKEQLMLSLGEWQREVSKFANSYEFMRANEKTMVVMVFGAVKAGKSTVGNFLAGKNFLRIDEENIYQKIYADPALKPVFEIEEKGRITKFQNDFFEEGYVDTTGAIQYFQLGGMKWLDSPGTGAVKKDGDTLDMEALVGKYLDDTDFGVFLISSEQPGLQEDFRYMKELADRDKPIMVVITKSDFEDIVRTADGKIAKDERKRPLKVTVPKEDAVRKMQEDYVKNEAKEYGVYNLDVMSISVKLAKDALKNGDEKLFEASNMDRFYATLSECIGENAAELKMKNPKNKINNLIAGIVEGMESLKIGSNFKGVKPRIAELTELKQDLEKKQAEIGELKKRITRELFHEMEIELKTRFDQMKTELDTSGSVNVQNFGSELRALVNQKARVILNKKIKELISGFDEKCLTLRFNMEYDIQVEKKYKEIERRFEVVEYVERDPDGVIETVMGWLGRKYTSRKSHTHVDFVKVEVGDNIFDEYDKVLVTLEDNINKFVAAELTRLSESYYAKQITMFDGLITALIELEHDLMALKVR